MRVDKSKIKKILVVSLSNIGDIVLTFPVFDIIRRDFPEAMLDLIVGPKGELLVKDNPAFHKIFVYHKNQSVWTLLAWMRALAKEHYDLVVDLRNTAIPFLIFPQYRTPLMLRRPKGLHMREQHLARLKAVHDFQDELARRASLYISTQDMTQVDSLLKQSFYDPRFSLLESKFIIIAPGARAENKRWLEEGFVDLADHLARHYQVPIGFVGDENDRAGIARIIKAMKNPAMDLSGRLTLPQLGAVLAKAVLVITNDSAPMHLASYLNIPVVAFFGPTDPEKYGPWSLRHSIIQKRGDCLACRGDHQATHHCLVNISVQDALAVIDPLLRKVLYGQ